MRAVFPQAKDIQKIIAAATAFLSEATFRATKDGIKMFALDPANVAVIGVELYQNIFTDYEVEEEEEKFTINLEDLKKILLTAKAKDSIEFALDNEKNKFIVNIKGKSRRSFSLPLIETEGENVDIENLRSNLDLVVKAEIDSKSFGEIIKAAKIISDEIKMTSDPDNNKIIISAEGELKDMRVELSSNDEYVLSIEVPTKAVARYSIEYLYKLTRLVQVTDIMKLSFNTNKPLWIDYKSTEKFLFSFVLAPRE